MPTNKPGCGPCCVTEQGCHKDLSAGPCTGNQITDASTETTTTTVASTWRWVTTAEIIGGGDLDPDILTAGWYFVDNGEPVADVPPGEFTDCLGCSGSTLDESPYVRDDGAPNGDPLTPGVTTTVTCECVVVTEIPARYDGRGCSKCLPRYLCARVVFTPNAYSEVCPHQFTSKMYYTCEHSWANYDTPVNVGVNQYRQTVSDGYGGEQCECFYRVTVASAGESVTYDGIPYDELNSRTYDLDTEEGTYEVSVGSANVVPNPLANMPCAPCVCATCLPGTLLVSLDGVAACPGKVYCDTVSMCATGDNSVTFELPQGDVTVTIVPSTGSACALDVSIQATFGNLTGDGLQTIGLESIVKAEGQDCDQPNLVECRELPDGDPTRHITPGTRGSGSCVGWANLPKIDASFPVLDDGVAAFTVRVRDGACDTCDSSSPTCKGACPSLESYGLSCTPPDLTAVIVSQCKSVTSTMVPQETAGFIGQPHPLQDGTIGTRFCQAFYSGARVSPTSTNPFQEFYCGATGHQFYFALYYNPLLCSGDTGARPERYRLAVRFSRVCTDFLESTIAVADVLPTTFSCDPPAWEFHTGLTWASLYGSFTGGGSNPHPCLGYEKCCPDDQDEEIVIRVML